MLKTTLFVQDQMKVPTADSEGRNTYCFVKYNLAEIKSVMPRSALLKKIENDSILSINKNGISVLEDYDNFIKVTLPELKSAKIEVQDPHINIKRFNLIKDIFAEHNEQKYESKPIKPRASRPTIDCYVNVKAGAKVDQDTVYIVNPRSYMQLIKEIPPAAKFHHGADGRLLVTLTHEQYSKFGKSARQHFKINHLKKKYYGDRESLFFGADKRPISELITPTVSNELRIVMHRTTNQATLLRTVLVAGEKTSTGERPVAKCFEIMQGDKAVKLASHSVNINYREASDDEKLVYMSTKEYDRHPYRNKESGIVSVDEIKTEHQHAIEQEKIKSTSMGKTMDNYPINQPR